MVGYFYDYIRNIIIFLLFTSFLQIIMPMQKYKNYIQLVFGLILIFIMIKPAKDIFKKFNKIDISKEYTQVFNPEINEEKYNKIQSELANNILNENIKFQIQKIIGDKYKINSIDIKLKEDKYFNVVVKEIKLDLSKEEKSGIYVKPFSKNNYENQNNYDFEKNNIKKIISDFYNLNLGNIFITIT